MKELRNYHTHTYRCGHAVGSDEDYIQAAIQAGYKVLGFSDHSPYRDYPNNKVHMDWEQVDDYIQSITALKEKYKDQIEIHLGFEAEYYPYTLEEKKELLSRVEYLLLGQHFSEPTGMVCSYFRRNTDEELEEYADMVCEALDTGIFTYLCHPDVFMNRQESFNEKCAEISHRIVRKAVETNTPLELNIRGVTYGKRAFGSQMEYDYPHKDFWRIAAQYPVQCIIGIDAHDPRDLLQLHYIEEGLREMEDLHLNFIEDPIL